MKKILGFIAVSMIACSVALAAPDVEVKYSGPSGQGIIIYFAPSTGVTNFSLTAEGITNATFVGPVSMASPTASGDITANGDIIGDGATSVTNMADIHATRLEVDGDAVLTTDDTTERMVLSGTVTNGGTVTFSTSFGNGVVPVVVLTGIGAVSATNSPVLSLPASSNTFTVLLNGIDSQTNNYVAVGNK